MSQPISFSLRFLFTSILLTLVLFWHGEFLLKLLLPIYRWEINFIDAGYHVLSLNIDNVQTERAFVMNVNLSKTMYVGGHFIFPNPQGQATASSIVGHVWQMAVLFLATIFSWKSTHFYIYGIRLLVGVPFLFGILMLDIPFALLASLKGLILQQLELDSFSALILWDNFLEGGGRWALGLAAGLVTVRLTDLTFYLWMLRKHI